MAGPVPAFARPASPQVHLSSRAAGRPRLGLPPFDRPSSAATLRKSAPLIGMSASWSIRQPPATPLPA
eukprot:6061386-Alexandrium_andersonii.AAC.1